LDLLLDVPQPLVKYSLFLALAGRGLTGLTLGLLARLLLPPLAFRCGLALALKFRQSGFFRLPLARQLGQPFALGLLLSRAALTGLFGTGRGSSRIALLLGLQFPRLLFLAQPLLACRFHGGLGVHYLLLTTPVIGADTLELGFDQRLVHHGGLYSFGVGIDLDDRDTAFQTDDQKRDQPDMQQGGNDDIRPEFP
jgi:hypothetical protein